MSKAISLNTKELQDVLQIVNSLPTGGGGSVITEEWQRPSNWPDLSSLGKPEAGTIYLTYDCRDAISGASNDALKLWFGGGVWYSLYRGRVENGEFIAAATIAENKNADAYDKLPINEGDFVVYKLIINSKWGFYTNDTNYQPCVEVYGCANGDIGTLANVNSYSKVGYGLKAMTMYGNAEYTIGGAGNRNCYIEYANVEEWDKTVKPTSFVYAFGGAPYIKELKAVPCDTSAVTTFSSMYRGDSSLEKVDISTLDTSSATDMSYMFNGCTRLKTIDAAHFVTNKVTNFTAMFTGCACLYTVDFSGLDTSACTTSPLKMFDGCKSLINLTVGKITTSFYLKDCINLSHDSLMNVINALEPTDTTLTLTIGNTNIAKLTEEELAIATEKGWTVV